MEDNRRRLISEGRPNQSTNGVWPNGYNRTYNPNIANKKNTNISINNNYRRPSNLTPPRYNYNNDSENENEESESRISQTRRKVDNITGKVVKAKKTISFFSKYKFIIIGCIIAAVIVILFMFLMMVKELDGDSNKENITSYSELVANVNGSNNEELWWPIGSKEITSSIELEGTTLEFRSGEPVDTQITAGFDDPDYRGHGANDIAAPGDIYLIAMADGVISYISSNRDNGYYNTYPTGENYSCSNYDGMIEIKIEYNNGFVARYLHLEGKSIPSYLKEGDKVYQGQVVGKMGNTGCSTGQHLHLALYLNNEVVDPSNYVYEDNPRPMTSNSISTSEELLKNSTSNLSGIPGNGQFVEGTSNQQTVCLTLKSYYSNNVVAGLMVNIEKESSFDPTNVTLDTNNEYSGGLFQWNAGRLTGLKSRHSDNWTSIANQIEYFQYEISTSESATAPILADTTSSATEIAYDFCETFERAANCSPRADENLANKYLSYVNNGCK